VLVERPRRRTPGGCDYLIPRRAMSVRFNDSNLVSCAGLAAVTALAAQCGLARLLTDRSRIAAKGGANATAKILALIAGT
jgi:hypothetical protein